LQLTALKVPQFRSYFTAAVGAVNASWVFRIILSWEAWEMTGRPAYSGIVAAASLLPIAVAGPFFGVLADRVDILRAYRLVNLGLMLMAGAFLALSLAGWLTPTVLLGVALCFGTALAAYHPVRQSIAPRLVQSGDIPSVVALTALNFNFARLACPAIAGLLIAQVGVEAAAFVSILLFLPAQIAARRLAPRGNGRLGRPTRFLADFRGGVRAVAASAWRRLAVLLAITAIGPLRGMQELLSVVADGRFGRGVEGLGLLGSAVGGGALVSVLAHILLPARSPRVVRAGIGVSVAAGFAAAQVIAHTGLFPLAVAATAVTGFCTTFLAVEMQVTLQTGLDDAVRGRVMSLWMLSVTFATSLSASGIGALADLASLDWAVRIVFGLCLAMLLVAVAVERSRRRADIASNGPSGDPSLRASRFSNAER
jgi:MFS family permease